jgi:hypothetical protein
LKPARQVNAIVRRQKQDEALYGRSDADKHQVAAEILRQLTGMGQGDLSEATLKNAADELFRTLDEEEAANAPR